MVVVLGGVLGGVLVTTLLHVVQHMLHPNICSIPQYAPPLHTHPPTHPPQPGTRADEARAINLSLTTLAMCIEARAKKVPTHVPFRSSKLTRLLQESLGGNAKTSLVVAVADAVQHTDESAQSLAFGSRAMCVKTHAVVNESLDVKVLTKELLAQLGMRDAQYFAGHADGVHMEALNGKLKVCVCVLGGCLVG